MEAAAAWRVEAIAFQDPVAQRLVAMVQQEYAELYGNPDETPLDEAYFTAPAGAFFVGLLGDEPVATGAWRLRRLDQVDGEVAEIKRMYVVPSARRAGLARSMLEHLELTAARAGVATMVLETGLRQPEAIALYTSAGYTPIAPFGHYAWSPIVRCLAKTLDAAVGSGER